MTRGEGSDELTFPIWNFGYGDVKFSDWKMPSPFDFDRVLMMASSPKVRRHIATLLHLIPRDEEASPG